MTATTISRSGRQAPGPRGHPVFGNLPDLRRDQLALYMGVRQQYGDVARLRGLGRFSWFLISHPEHIEYVLKSKNYHKGQFVEPLRRLVGNGLLTSEGEFWRRQRRLAAPAFHRQRLTLLAEIMTEAAEQTAERWRRNADRGRPLDVAADMMRMTLGIVGRALFSTDISGAADTVGQAVTFALEYVSYRSLHPFGLPDRVPTPFNRRFRRAMSTIDAVVDGIIAERRRAGGDEEDLLSMLMAARDEETGEAMSDRQLRDEVKTLILAGHETTAVALSWAWYLLATNPDVEARLHDELAGVLNGRSPGLEDLPSLPYTRSVIDETLRLYPPAWVVARQARDSDRVGDYTIPAGSPIVVSPYVTHRHPEFWNKPDLFHPERFAGRAAEERPQFAYFPFGGGPRICIGNSFALMETQLLLATLAQRFRLGLDPDHPVVPEASVTLRPKYGVRMILHERST